MLFSDRTKFVNDVEVLVKVLWRKARDGATEVVLCEVIWRTKFACEKTTSERRIAASTFVYVQLVKWGHSNVCNW